jgi:hypothetical protein
MSVLNFTYVTQLHGKYTALTIYQFVLPLPETGPRDVPAPCTIGTGSFSRGESGQGVALTAHRHLGLKLKKEAEISLFPLWASMACSRVNFSDVQNVVQSNERREF